MYAFAAGTCREARGRPKSRAGTARTRRQGDAPSPLLPWVAMKCADIDDDVFMAACRRDPADGLPGCCLGRNLIRDCAGDAGVISHEGRRELPEKLFLAKARKLGENPET